MDKNKPIIKGVRTFLQALIPMLAVFTAVLSTPQVSDYVSTLPFVVQVGGLSAIIGFTSWLQNAIEDWLK